ncbi:MAG: L-ribulose-5-phosphate 3-epimerase [Arcticibacterium sp.]|jgi:L-ribulose-5-phosphate 3-epimerase
MINRRLFLRNSLLGGAALYSSSYLLNACTKKEDLPKISLAQWSLHRQFFDKLQDPNDFATIARKMYGIEAVEYVNQFYIDTVNDLKFWAEMKRKAEDADVKSLLMMVDNEGDLAIADDSERRKSVENHFKWVDAAKLLGCHSIRVNAFGDENKEIYTEALKDGMAQLADYAAKENINVIIENHGLFSADGALISEVIKDVNKPNFGTFPDFGNWCMSAKWGSTQIPCDIAYDRYQGVADFLPYAKAVSAKSYDFDDSGEDTRIDYGRLLQMVKDSDYDGYIGIEYEGSLKSEHEGILATKALIEKKWADLT